MPERHRTHAHVRTSHHVGPLHRAADALVEATRPVTVALAGQPNVGKSTIFNALTGLNQHVGNWPGKTIAQKTGEYECNGMRFRLIDLPGTYSLTANSEEERIAREYIIREQPDVVIAVVDAAILERSLYLVAELLQLAPPVVLALNMMDVAAQEGIHIEPPVLEAALGIPIVPMSASRDVGIDALAQVVYALVQGQMPYAPVAPGIRPDHQQLLDQIESLIVEYVPSPYRAHWVALKLLEGDQVITSMVKEQLSAQRWGRVHRLLRRHEDAILDVAGARYEWIGRMIRAAVVRPQLGQVTLTERLDRLATHPLWGLGVLLAVLGVTFWLTYTLGTPIQEWLDLHVVQAAATWLSRVLAGGPPWLSSLLIDGVLSGAGLMLTFVPILVIFFAALGVLEDTGYMARGAYVMDRFMHVMGLHGKSFLPLCLGFGCNVPAVMGSRIIESRRGRLMTILLAPLVPCTARLAVLATLTPIFFGAYAVWVTWGLIGLNLLVLGVLGAVLSRTLFKGERAAFIMELPLYHVPNARTIALSVWHNLVAFLRKASTVILLVSVLVWALSHYPGPDVAHSFLGIVGRALEPFGKLMGLEWPMLVALITSFVAKENVIATLGVLYGAQDPGSDLATALSQALSPAAALAFLAAQMLFIPCVATVAAIRQETGSWHWTTFSVGLLMAISLLAAVLIYQGAVLLGWGV
ncbi:MAG: ferrous iron transport protein B [Anaerolineae bacterium]|nr:ferrous iron transport protein B [Anaerolineae bacterium]